MIQLTDANLVLDKRHKYSLTLFVKGHSKTPLKVVQSGDHAYD
jgi:hypothetical protein